METVPPLPTIGDHTITVNLLAVLWVVQLLVWGYVSIYKPRKANGDSTSTAKPANNGKLEKLLDALTIMVQGCSTRLDRMEKRMDELESLLHEDARAERVAEAVARLLGKKERPS